VSNCPSRGLTVGQRVFGLADWTRNGSLTEYTTVEARNLAPASGEQIVGAIRIPAGSARRVRPPARAPAAKTIIQVIGG